MLNMKKTFGYTMLLVEDMNKSVEFYKKVFQLGPEFNSPRWSQFNLDGVLIALHNAHSWSDENDPLKGYVLDKKGSHFPFTSRTWINTLNIYNHKKSKLDMVLA